MGHKHHHHQQQPEYCCQPQPQPQPPNVYYAQPQPVYIQQAAPAKENSTCLGSCIRCTAAFAVGAVERTITMYLFHRCNNILINKKSPSLQSVAFLSH